MELFLWKEQIEKPVPVEKIVYKEVPVPVEKVCCLRVLACLHVSLSSLTCESTLQEVDHRMMPALEMFSSCVDDYSFPPRWSTTKCRYQ